MKKLMNNAGKMLGIFILTLLAFSSFGQSRDITMNGSHNALDTVTNTGTTTWTSPRIASTAGTVVTIYLSVTKISGTVGGTVTIQGSINGTTWKALNTIGTQTALATATATDATNTYHWILGANPFPYYRVSWTGTGTMVASATAKALLR